MVYPQYSRMQPWTLSQSLHPKVIISLNSVTISYFLHDLIFSLLLDTSMVAIDHFFPYHMVFHWMNISHLKNLIYSLHKFTLLLIFYDGQVFWNKLPLWKKILCTFSGHFGLFLIFSYKAVSIFRIWGVDINTDFF